MHHPESSADSGSVRKMAHSAVFHRKGSNTGSGSGPVLSTPANPVVGNSHVPSDDYQPSLLIQCQPPAGSSSPGTHHIPPHSLNLHPQPTQPTGAQIKKKSGFQITSVTPAQISVSTNNSIAEDTESYDDLDESHTEDLSSSEILDVSLSRANDVVGAERSSSEETLNNFQEAETPGAISPNQPSHPHSLNPAQQRSGSMVNGTMHPHHPNHAVYSRSSVPVSPASALNSGALTSVTQKMPSNIGVSQENVSQVAHPSITAQPVGAVALGSLPGLHSSATATTVSIINPQTSSVSNVNILSSANVPVREGISASCSSGGGGGGGGFPHNVISGSGGSAVAGGGNLIPTANVGISQQLQHQNNSNIPMTTTSSAAAAVGASGGMGVSGGLQARVGAGVLQPAGTPVTSVAPAPASPAPAQPAPAPAPAVATASSRFRVVKLDSSSEPFKKGRWTCTEFYDKEAPPSASSSSACDTGSPGMRQLASEGFAGASERDSASGSSVSSTMSTLSHYSEIVCGGETGGPPIPQHDYASVPQGFQGIPHSMGISQTQTPMQPQDAHSKATAPPSAPANVHQPAHLSSLQTTNGLSTSAVHQLTYAQAVANPPTASTQGLVGVKQQKIGYAAQLPPQSANPQAAPVQVRPEYNQTHQGVLQGAAVQPVPTQTGSLPSGPPNGSSQMMGALQQQPQTLLHAQPQQPSAHLASMSSMPSHVSGAAGLGQQGQNHPALEHQKPQSLPTQVQNPGLGSQMPATVQTSQASAPSVPPLNPQSDPQAPLQPNTGRMPPQGVAQNKQSSAGLSQDHSNAAQALSHAAQASALYASLPTFTTTQLQDAQRLLLQHQSALLGLPKLPGGEAASTISASQGQDTEGSAAAGSALSASAGTKAADGEEDGSSGASVVAIDNKIEQAMDLVKSHLMYAVREEVEVLKEQIKELIERNSQLEQENTLLKTLASPEQMAQFQAQVQTGSPPAPPTAATPGPPNAAAFAQTASHSSGPSA